MKRGLLVIPILLALVFGLNGQAFSADKIVVKTTSYYAESHPVSKSMNYFKEQLEQESNGRFEVQYFPNSQLGAEEVFIDHVKRNTVQVAISGGLAKKDENRLNLVEPPFVIETWKQAYGAYNGPIAEKIKGDYHKNTGSYIMGFMVNGFREISSSMPVTSMADLGKLKLRVPTTDLYVNMFKGFGVNTVMMPMSEVYNALETKVVDGQDNPYPTVVASGWWEVQKYLLESHHMFTANPVLVNGKFYDGLSAADKAVFDKCLKDTIDHNWKISEEADNDARKFLEEKGLKIHVPSPELRQQMKDSLKDFYVWFYKSVPGSQEIIEAMDKLPK
jgi:tripartite ATP-independent transporter DctP family solute receptor